MRLRTAAARDLADLAVTMADPTRLAKGRTYHRKGQVGSLEVRPGGVSAAVLGSRETPYVAWVSTRPAPGHLAGELQELAATDPLTARLVERGTVPSALVDAAVGAGLDLVPADREVAFDCSCPDWGDPCKHAVAVLFAFADAVDDRPELLLTWRSIELGGLMAPAEGAHPAQARGSRRPAGGTGGDVVELLDALRRLADRAGTPQLRRSAADALVRVERQGRVWSKANPRVPGQEENDDWDDPLRDFFTGAMPSSGPLLGGERGLDLAPLGDQLATARLVVDGVDARPALADAAAVIADFLKHDR